MKTIAANPVDSVLSINQMVIFIMFVTIAPTACDPLLLLFSSCWFTVTGKQSGISPGDSRTRRGRVQGETRIITTVMG